MFLRAFLLSLLLCFPAKAFEDDWAIVRDLLFAKQQITFDETNIKIEAPYRAEDASMVPIKIELTDNIIAQKVTIIVDHNPMPVVAIFTLDEPIAGWFVDTRIRIHSDSYVRVIAQIDGKLYENKAFVKAAGGCSSPASKDIDNVLKMIGRMKLHIVGNEAHIMILHPQFSGMQKDQLTGYDIPAKFITELEVKSHDKKILSMKGGISLSENPNIRFKIPDIKSFTVVVKDSDKNTFTDTSH